MPYKVKAKLKVLARKKTHTVHIFQSVGGWHICSRRELSIELNVLPSSLLPGLPERLQLCDSALRAQTDHGSPLIPCPWKLPFRLLSCILVIKVTARESVISSLPSFRRKNNTCWHNVLKSEAPAILQTWNWEHLVGRLVHMECVLYVRGIHAKQSCHSKNKRGATQAGWH